MYLLVDREADLCPYIGIVVQVILWFYSHLSSQEVSMRRSQSSVASTVPELPGLFDKHSLVEESADDLVQGVWTTVQYLPRGFHFSSYVIFLKDIICDDNLLKDQFK